LDRTTVLHRRLRKSLSMFLAAALLAPSFAAAQELPAPGTRVRVHRTPKENQPVLGAIQAWRPDTVLVLSDSAHARVAIPVANIVQFETSAGSGPATAKDAQTGAIIGALAGLAAASLNDNNESLWKYPLIGTLGMIGGAAVGALVGSVRRTEQWRSAPIPRGQPVISAAELPVTVRVRIDAPRALGGSARTGTLVARTNDSLTFLPDGNGRPLTLPSSSVRRLEVSKGRHHNAWSGAITGGLFGGLIGGAYGAAWASSEEPANAAGGAVVGALAVGGIGFVAGMFLGGLSESERWEPMP